MADESAQVGILLAIVWAPDALEEVFMGEHFTRIAGEFAEQIVFGWSEMDLLLITAHKAMGVIDQEAIFTAAAIKRALVLIAGQSTAQASSFVGASKRHPYTSEQLVHAKGFGEIIIGTLIQGFNFHAFLIVRGENNDRRAAPLAQAAEKFQAIQRR